MEGTVTIKKCTAGKLITELQKFDPETKVEVADCSIDSSCDEVCLDYYEHDDSLDIYSEGSGSKERISQ